MWQLTTKILILNSIYLQTTADIAYLIQYSFEGKIYMRYMVSHTTKR